MFSEEATSSSGNASSNTLTSNNSTLHTNNNFTDSLPLNVVLINNSSGVLVNQRKSSLNLPLTTSTDFPSGYYPTGATGINSGNSVNDHLNEEHLNSYYHHPNQQDSFTLPSMHQHHNNFMHHAYHSSGGSSTVYSHQSHLPLPQHCHNQVAMGSGDELLATYSAAIAAATSNTTTRGRVRGQNVTNGIASLSQGPTSRKSIFSGRVSLFLIFFNNSKLI